MNSHSLEISNSRLRQALASGSVGAAISPDTLKATIEATRAFQLPQSNAIEITRDIPYGPDPRHQFDWFRPKAAAKGAPAKLLLFVHGGGFVGGDRRLAGTPLHDNIGVWAATNGLQAATITYRLAPQNPWPAGGKDVQRATAQVVAHIEKATGEAPAVYLMGHSAGAVHAAAAVTLQPNPAQVAGCILISGFYINRPGATNPLYFGDNPGKYEEQSSASALSASDLSLFLVIAQNDPPIVHDAAVTVMQGRVANGKPTPQFLLLDGHNHFSPMMLFNSSIDTLGPRLLEFIGRP